MFLQWPDQEVQSNGLEAVSVLCKTAWPRIPPHLGAILRPILLCFEQGYVETPSKGARAELDRMRVQCEEVLLLLVHCHPSQSLREQFWVLTLFLTSSLLLTSTQRALHSAFPRRIRSTKSHQHLAPRPWPSSSPSYSHNRYERSLADYGS